MKTRSRILYAFLFGCLFFAGCKKEEEIDKLPPATASGLGTFGCLINGKAWPVYEKGYHYASAFYENRTLFVYYEIKPDELSQYTTAYVGVSIKNIVKPGCYIVNFNDIKSGSAAVTYKGIDYFCTDPINASGFAWVNITRLDTAQFGYAAGTFGFTLFDEAGLSKVKVESGRFDVRL